MRPQLLIFLILGAASVFAITLSASNQDIINKAKVKQERLAKKAKSEKAATPVVSEKDSVTKKDNTRFLIFMFVLGAIAITAMVLPGVSGSFLLLVLGGYFDVLAAIAARDTVVLSVFLAGCAIGLIVSSRVIHALLERWHDGTMAYLLGLVFGSLWVIWPFKQVHQEGNLTVYLKDNIMPSGFGNIEMMTLISTLAGMIIVAGFLWYEKLKKKPNK